MAHFKQAIGIDIGTHAVKVALAERSWTRGLQVQAVEFRPNGNGEQAVAERIHAFLAMHRASAHPCVVGLRGETTLLRSLRLPHGGDARSVRERVDAELERFRDLAEGETISSHDLMPGPRHPERVLLAIARNEAAEQAVALPESLGLTLADIVPSAVAFFNAVSFFIPNEDPPCLCIELGHENTEVVVGNHRGIRFARTFAAGVADITRNPEARAEGIARWLDELQACMELHDEETRDPENLPAQVILAGGGASEPGLHEALTERLHLPVARLTDLRAPAGMETAARHPTAAGLALAGLRQGPVSLSLLPLHVREQVALRGQLRYWGLACACLLALALVILTGLWADSAREQRYARGLQTRLGTLLEQKDALEELHTSNSALRQELHPMRIAVHNGEILRGVLHAVSTTRNPDDWIILMADANSYFDAPEPAPSPERVASATPPPPSPGVNGDLSSGSTPAAPSSSLLPHLVFERFVIEGYTPAQDLSTVQEMIDALQAHPAILAADVLGDNLLRVDPERDQAWSASGARLFAVELTVPKPH